MLNFGDEFTLEGYRIPWLIWIQLMVLLLLLFALLFSFTIIPVDPSSHDTAASASTTHNNHSSSVTNPLLNTRGVENLSVKGEIETSASTGIVREENAVGEASSLYFLHPCYYFKLARLAFLKCLGLDSTSESDSPSTQKRRKRKES
ncbi:uncharacterized protein LOC133291225 [Gastrolobium bilobum]|uniref:uncharacterized protein LOC133291225 n=1 Tax=Gastrolobium bilobum TaxID=150636 RepID=UPI002AB11F47|nr:uncharacterized protein LOC133291225 [Gastrolobium bilobum]